MAADVDRGRRLKATGPFVFVLFAWASAHEPEPPFTLPEALAIGVGFGLEREAVDPADDYVSTGVMRESPDEPFRYTAYLAEAYEPRAMRPEERVHYQELGLTICDMRAHEDLPCPGLGTSNRRTKLIAGRRPVRDDADDAGWLVPVTIISLDQEEPSYWLTAWLINVRQDPDRAGGWIVSGGREWFSEN